LKGRQAALQALREGKKNSYKEDALESVYDEVSEDKYSEIVRGRMKDDWIVEGSLINFAISHIQMGADIVKMAATSAILMKTSRAARSRIQVDFHLFSTFSIFFRSAQLCEQSRFRSEREAREQIDQQLLQVVCYSGAQVENRRRQDKSSSEIDRLNF